MGCKDSLELMVGGGWLHGRDDCRIICSGWQSESSFLPNYEESGQLPCTLDHVFWLAKWVFWSNWKNAAAMQKSQVATICSTVRGHTVYRTSFGAAKPFLWSTVWELLSNSKNSQEYKFQGILQILLEMKLNTYKVWMVTHVFKKITSN